MDCLFHVWITPCTIDSLYEWPPEWSTPGTKDLFPCLQNNELCRCRNYFWTKYTLILRMYPLHKGELKIQVFMSNKNRCMFFVSRNVNNSLILIWNNSTADQYQGSDNRGDLDIKSDVSQPSSGKIRQSTTVSSQCEQFSYPWTWRPLYFHWWSHFEKRPDVVYPIKFKQTLIQKIALL